MLTLFSGFLLIVIFISFLFYRFFSYLARISVVRTKSLEFADSLVTSPISHALFTGAFIFILVENVVGNIPLSMVPTLFYSKTLTLALIF